MEFKAAIFGLVILALIFSGCAEQPLDVGDTGAADVAGTDATALAGTGTGAAVEDITPATCIISNLVCPNKCVGTTLSKGGTCIAGECSYATVEENSAECGYTSAASTLPSVEVERIECIYTKPPFASMQMLFEIRNTGTTTAKAGQSVRFVGDDGALTKCMKLNDSVESGKRLFERNFVYEPFSGQGLFISSEYGSFKEFSYKLLYCPGDCFENCSEANGVVFYAGSNEGCTIRD